MPGISAVSPPTRAQPASAQPSAMPAITARGLRHLQMPGGEIVQEEQRLGALHDQVVDAHRHQVDAHLVVQPGLDRNLQLGADAVGGRYQDRVGESRGAQVEQRAETADPAQRAGPGGGAGQRGDGRHQRLPGIDIDSGGAVVERDAGGGGRIATGHAWSRSARAGGRKKRAPRHATGRRQPGRREWRGQRWRWPGRRTQP